MLNARQLWWMLVKPQFGAVHILVFGGIMAMGVLALRGPYDPTSCEKLLQSDLEVLCRSRDSRSAFRREREHPSGSTFLQATGTSISDLPQCRETQAETRPYVHDFSIGASATTGGLQVVPGKNEWGVLMANSTLHINGKVLTFDDIIYGYDLIFENLGLFSFTSWFGVSTQQDPSDAFQLSSLIWKEQPDLLIEIGTNTGGGAIFYASVMREYNADSLVLTVDPKDPGKDWANNVGKGCPTCKDVRCTKIWHSKNVQFIHGYSSAPEVLAQVERIVPRFHKVMVMHDGSHFYQDVLQDLQNYDKFTTVGSYMVVQDTKMTRMYTPIYGDKYPMGAARDFLSGQGHGRYVVDKQYEYLIYSQHHDGWLRKVQA